MPSHKQIMVEAKVTPGGKGGFGKGSSSYSERVAAAFPASPIHQGILTDDILKDMGNKLLLDGVVNDEGYHYGEFSRDYSGAPNLEDVDLAEHNLPSPYVPNPASPGPGSINDSDKPAPPEGFGQVRNQNFGTGEGSELQPSKSSGIHSGHKIGDYLKGRAAGT